MKRVNLLAAAFAILGALPAVVRGQDAFTLPEARVGVAYEFPIRAEGGLTPLHWKITGGQLPPGIELQPSGTLHGTPTTLRPESYQFAVEVSDSSQPPQIFTQVFSVQVKAAQLQMILRPDDVAGAPLKIVTPKIDSVSAAVTSLQSAVSPASAPTPAAASVLPASAAASVAHAPAPPCPDNPDPPCINGTLQQWNYVVSGKMHTQPDASNVGIEALVNGAQVPLADDEVAKANTIIDKSKGRFVIWLKGALVKDQTVQVRQVVNGVAASWSGAILVAGPSSGEACLQAFLDCRHTFETSAYLGLGIDTFASGETRLYLNPNAPNGPKERMVGGIDFGYRLTGTRQTRFSSQRYAWPYQLWVYGETVHGVRSTDVDCTKNSTFLTCQTALALPTRAPDQILYTFRNATSLEGFAGLRYEFLTLQASSSTPANLYVKAQAGFLTVAGAPSAAKAIHHFGLGAIATRGQFENSYLEFGYGRNDLFAQHRLRRWKVDAYLEKRLSNGISFFTQILVDTDVGPGADSIQSYLGFNFDLWRLKDWISTK